MTDEVYRPPRGLQQKVSAFRADALKQDWVKDGFASFGKTNYKYLPTDKIKKNLAPLYAKHGLEFKPVYRDVQWLPAVGQMNQHVMVTLEATLIDVDTGEHDTDVVYGEAADSGDKALGKAMTYAYKAWASNKFGLADGVDPDDIGDNGGAGYRPKNAQEETQVRSKILEQGIKPPAPKVPSVPKTPEAPKEGPADEPAEEPKEEPDHENVPMNAPEEVPVPPAPKAPAVPKAPKAPAPMDSQPAFKLSPAQRKALDKLVASWEAAVVANKATQEEYDAMMEKFNAVSSAPEYMAFITSYKRSD